jgi:galactokinase
LVRNERVDDFAQALAQGYESQAGLHPEIYITRASNGAELLE